MPDGFTVTLGGDLAGLIPHTDAARVALLVVLDKLEIEALYLDNALVVRTDRLSLILSALEDGQG